MIREPKGSRSAHFLERCNIELIPSILENPALLVMNAEENRLALITNDTNRQGYPLLLALKLNSIVQEKKVNQITSFYGREHCREYLERQEHVWIVDKEKAKQLSRLLRLQLPMTWKVLDYNTNLPQNPPPVNQNKEKSPCLPRSQEEIAKNIQACGFRATSGLIHNVCKLDKLSGRDNTLKEVSESYKHNCDGLSKEETEIVREIAAECRQQELQRPAEPLEPEP